MSIDNANQHTNAISTHLTLSLSFPDPKFKCSLLEKIDHHNFPCWLWLSAGLSVTLVRTCTAAAATTAIVDLRKTKQ
jgi:hypothetical protein